MSPPSRTEIAFLGLLQHEIHHSPGFIIYSLRVIVKSNTTPFGKNLANDCSFSLGGILEAADPTSVVHKWVVSVSVSVSEMAPLLSNAKKGSKDMAFFIWKLRAIYVRYRPLPTKHASQSGSTHNHDSCIKSNLTCMLSDNHSLTGSVDHAIRALPHLIHSALGSLVSLVGILPA